MPFLVSAESPYLGVPPVRTLVGALELACLLVLEPLGAAGDARRAVALEPRVRAENAAGAVPVRKV